VWAACLGALVFALHPVQVEPVGWISGLKDVLSGMFALVAIYRFVIRAQRDDAAFAPDPLGTIALLLAMLAKPTACMTPVITLILDWILIRRDLVRALRANAVWLVMTIPFLVAARLSQGVEGIPGAPLWARPFIFGDAVAFYVYKLVLPVWLTVDYGRRPGIVMQSWSFYLAWIVPVAIGAALCIARRRLAWLVAGALIFVAAFLPVSGLFRFQFQFTSTVADHYLYLSMFGVGLIVACALKDLNSTRAYAVASAIVALLGVRALFQTQYWKDDRVIFTHAIEVNPESFVGHTNLGHALALAGERDAAIEEFRKSIALNQDYPTAFEKLGWSLAEKGDIDGAIAAIEKSIEIRARLPRSIFPNYMEDHNRIGQVLLSRGRYDDAIRHFEALLAINPEHAEARKYLEIAKTRKAATLPGS
ncbi:MAG: tetratricopeptide repeat protein, partial [Tepidisphaeraceae bacterium]